MRENPKFIGRRYDEKERKGLTKALKSWSDEAIKPIEGELEKTEEEITMIETINSIIKSELQSLGFETYDPISKDKIHILSGGVFKEKFPDLNMGAFFTSTNDVVYINRSATDTKARLFSCLLHELIHRASATKFYVGEHGGGVYDARLGYRIRSPWKEPERENRLRGFNEIMTDYTVYKILLKNQELLEKDIGITKEEIQGPIYTYMHYGPILKLIIKKISRDKGISSQKAFDDLERGQFKNNILALRDVERSFGKGSLEVLSFLEVLKKEGDNNKLEKMIKNFFAEEDETKRQDIRLKILAFVDKNC